MQAKSLTPIGIGALALWIFSVLVVGYAGNDDKFITYFVADAIAEGRGLTNLNGAYEEQSSTVLFTYLLALTSFLTGRFTAEIGYGLSIFFYAACLWPTTKILRHFTMPWWYGVLILLAPPVLYWSASGMENSFYLFLTLWAMLACAQAVESARALPLLFVALTGAALPLTRPEGIAVVFCAMAIYVILSRFQQRALIVAGSLVAGACAAIAARLLAGLPFFPLPVYAKTATPFLEDLQAGIGYLAALMGQFPVYGAFFVVVGAIIVLYSTVRILFLSDGPRAPLTLLAVSFASATAAFAIVSGGDWMPFGRFLTVPAALVGLLLLVQITEANRRIAVALLLAVNLAGLWAISTYRGAGLSFFGQFDVEAEGFDAAWSDNRNYLHTRDILFVNRLLAEIEANPNQSLTIASIQMGMVPYYIQRATTKDVTFFDFLGLATIDVHNCAAVTDPFRYNPYTKLPELRACNGAPFDYVFDLGRDGFLAGVEAMGCEIVYNDALQLPSSRLKRPASQLVFIADCSDI